MTTARFLNYTLNALFKISKSDRAACSLECFITRERGVDDFLNERAVFRVSLSRVVVFFKVK